MDLLLDTRDYILIAGGAIWAFWEFVKMYRIRKNRKRSPIETDSKITSKIYSMLWPLQGEYRAMRVYIIQYHNGDKYYSGQSIQRASVTHEVLTPRNVDKSVKSVKVNNQNVSISTRLHQINVELSRTGIFRLDMKEQCKEQEMQSWLDVYGIESLFYVKLTNQRSQIIGMLCIEWDEPNAIDGRAPHILEYKKQIETIFNE
jgi:hypothetical protein